MQMSYQDEPLGDSSPLRSLDKMCATIFGDLEQYRTHRRRQLRRQRKFEKAERLVGQHQAGGDLFGQDHLLVSVDGKILAGERRRVVRREPELPSGDDPYVQSLAGAFGDFGGSTAASLILPTEGQFYQLDRALIHLHFARGEYDLVHSVVKQMASVPIWLENEIELLWDHASYRLESIKNPKLKLNSVNMYRIRKRLECPTLKRSGTKKYRISAAAMEHLLHEFAINPRPDKETKKELSMRTGLRLEVVSNWFKNKRQRGKKQQPPSRRRPTGTRRKRKQAASAPIGSISTTAAAAASCAVSSSLPVAAPVKACHCSRAQQGVSPAQFSQQQSPFYHVDSLKADTRQMMSLTHNEIYEPRERINTSQLVEWQPTLSHEEKLAMEPAPIYAPYKSPEAILYSSQGPYYFNGTNNNTHYHTTSDQYDQTNSSYHCDLLQQQPSYQVEHQFALAMPPELYCDEQAILADSSEFVRWSSLYA